MMLLGGESFLLNIKRLLSSLAGHTSWMLVVVTVMEAEICSTMGL
jgi:hypothetical protein